MIATLAEIKALLGITDTSKDAIMTAFMPIVQNKIIEITGQKFNSGREYSASTLSFATNTISDSESGFLDAKLKAAGNIRIDGSDYNDGYYTVSTVAAGAIVVTETLVSEDAGEEITLYEVKFPDALKAAFASMVYFDAVQSRDTGVSSESFGDYSVSYDKANMVQGYPKSVYDRLRPFIAARYL